MGKAKSGTRPRVYARLRPMFGRDAGGEPLFTIVDGTRLEYKRDDAADVSRYTFDRVFGMESTQEEVYEDIGAVSLSSLRQGFNSTIMAYGQTGSGKTFSMEGAKDRTTGQYTSRGLIPRIFEQVFAQFGSDPDVSKFEVTLQFIELYNEQLQDLLGKRAVVEVTADPTGGYQCKEAKKILCNDPKEAQMVYNRGCELRATAATKMNESSSRSHALLMVNVAWSESRGKRSAQLNLVDLAGSEGLKKTGAEGLNAKEGIRINLSLTKLALTVKCLAEGAKHVPYRESKLTMMLAKGLGGNNMLHIILALSNSREQVAEGTACLRFGQSCLSMTVNPNANKLEKEQAEMKAVIKEQMQEINDLQRENEELKQAMKEIEQRKASVAEADVPTFLVAKHIEVNKEALEEDLKDIAQQIEELKARLEETRREKSALTADDGAEHDLFAESSDAEKLFGDLEPQQRAEAMELRRRELATARMKAVAENEQEQKRLEGEIQQLVEIQTKLSTKLKEADHAAAMQEERIRAEMEEKAAEERREVEEKAAEMEAALRAAEQASRANEEERARREAELQEELKRKEATMRQEEELRQQLSAASAEETAALQEQMSKLRAERQEQDAEIERARAAQARLAELQDEANAAIEARQTQEEELSKMRALIAQMERDAQAKRDDTTGALQASLITGAGSLYEPAETMLHKAEMRLARKKHRGRRKGDADAVSRILDALPFLSACNDLRALTELEPANRALFQSLGGVARLVECMRPKGQNAPYATIVARTLPCVMDKEGRQLFHDACSGVDSDGEVRYRYLLALLQSSDPDDKENACLAIAAAAQDSEPTRQACFEHGLSAQVLGVLQEQCSLPIPRQRLQRVVVMAMAELANAYEPYKELLRTHEGVPMLLSFLTPSHDEYLIKETLQLLGRMTQNCPGIQAELQRYSAVERYAQLIFAQLHDTQISELAALALVNLISEVPACLGTIKSHPRYENIQYELLASMARALSASMLRNDQTEMALAGSPEFAFWGSAALGVWEDGNAGGDRKHTSFVDNPQFLLRAPAGTNLVVLLQDTLEATREQDKVKSRPLFLRLCMTAAHPETVSTRMRQLDINASGARPAAVNEESGCAMLEPNVQAALDISKTREVALRCHVKQGTPDEAWVIVPHVGCSHQHSRFVLAVFADKPVSLEGELSPWNKRVVQSSWTPLCSAPKGIANGQWRNCPQFQLINVGSSPTPVHAFLSYTERDVARNKRHTTVADPPGGVGAEERPLLSLYVMKSNVPDKRYVGTLSPFVEEYVAHSVVTNSWCVSSRWSLEPGGVYSILAVMAEGTTHEVPLRLTLYSAPEASGDVLLQPLSDSAEWHLTVLDGKTDAQGSTVVELLPQMVDGAAGGAKGGGGSTQAALVMETTRPDAFCSIVTEHEGVVHKMLAKYQQQQAVLSVPLTSGAFYTMTTRMINQAQEPLGGVPVRLLLYSTRPVQASPADGQEVDLASDAASQLVCKATASLVPYGGEADPADARRQGPKDGEGEKEARDPLALQSVITELEEQRDQLYEFTKTQLKSEPPAVLERLRADNAELREAVRVTEEQLRDSRAVAKASVAHAAPGGGEASQLRTAKANVDRLEQEKNLASAQLEAAMRQLEHNRGYIQSLDEQLQTALLAADEAARSGAEAGDAAQALKDKTALRHQLQDTQRQLRAAQEQALRLEQAIRKSETRTSNRNLLAAKDEGYADAERRAAEAKEEARQLREELEKQREDNKQLMQQSADQNPKSSACVVQ